MHTQGFKVRVGHNYMYVQVTRLTGLTNVNSVLNCMDYGHLEKQLANISLEQPTPLITRGISSIVNVSSISLFFMLI
jgi:hypothetical protein